jgi:hypothetical protein
MQRVPAGLGSCFSARAQGRAAAPALSAIASTGNVILQWESSQPINGFWDVLRAVGDGPFVQLARVGSGIRSFTDSVVKSGTAYRYEVRAFAFSTDPTLGLLSICGAPSDAVGVTVPPIAPRRRGVRH